MTEKFLQKSAKEVFWLSLFLGVPFIIWLYSIVLELNKRIPIKLKIPKLLYHVPFFYVLGYFPIILILLISGRISFDVIMPFHLTAMGASFLLLIIASVSILRFEKYKKIKKSNGFGLFFGMWYYVFGIWAIQPKLNEYVKSETYE